ARLDRHTVERRAMRDIDSQHVLASPCCPSLVERASDNGRIAIGPLMTQSRRVLQQIKAVTPMTHGRAAPGAGPVRAYVYRGVLVWRSSTPRAGAAGGQAAMSSNHWSARGVTGA